MTASSLHLSPPQPRPTPPDEPVSWGAGIAILALVTALGASALSAIPGLLLNDSNSLRRVTGQIAGMVVQNACFVAIPVLVLVLLTGRRSAPQTFGLRRPNKPIIVALVVTSAFVGYLALGAGLGALLGVGDQKDTLPQNLGASDSLKAGIAIGLAVTILAPFGEEFLMRGVVYPGLRNAIDQHTDRKVAIAAAAGINGLIFGALHLGGTDLIFIPVLITFGIILSVLYQLTGTLWAPIGLHLSNNTLAIATSLGWSVLGGLGLGVAAICGLLLGARTFSAWQRGALPSAA
jgi:uncharacterized protein